MDKQDFLRQVKKRHIPNDLFNIDGTGRDDERFVMVQTDDQWNVYYAERGCKTTDKYFDSESEALKYILEELTEPALFEKIKDFIKKRRNKEG